MSNIEKFNIDRKHESLIEVKKYKGVKVAVVRSHHYTKDVYRLEGHAINPNNDQLYWKDVKRIVNQGYVN